MNDKLLSWEEAVKWLRNNPRNKELVYQCYYDDPLDKAAARFRNSEEWADVENLLKPYIPGNVLDLGAGRGISSYAFAKAGCTVTALEPDPSSLIGAGAIHSLAVSTQVEISIIQEYGETLPFNDNSFDVVYGRAILHHARDLARLCKEAARVLKPGGVFLVTREHVISNKKELKQFLDSHPLHHLYGGENAYSLREYKEAIKGAGLELTMVIGPFENAINYAPMTRREHQAMVTSLLSGLVGSIVAGWLVNKEVVRRLCSRYLSQTSRVPGRHYSFLAVKK